MPDIHRNVALSFLVSTDNAAVQDDRWRHAVASMLETAARDILRGKAGVTMIRDENGNTVGNWVLIVKEEETE